MPGWFVTRSLVSNPLTLFMVFDIQVLQTHTSSRRIATSPIAPTCWSCQVHTTRLSSDIDVRCYQRRLVPSRRHNETLNRKVVGMKLQGRRSKFLPRKVYMMPMYIRGLRHKRSPTDANAHLNFIVVQRSLTMGKCGRKWRWRNAAPSTSLIALMTHILPAYPTSK